jgi:small subunit ribosomal protein S3Ae
MSEEKKQDKKPEEKKKWTKKDGETVQEKPAQQSEPKPQESQEKKEVTAKKWKGKDWFAILSPKAFGEKFISETPATDPEYVLGRVLEVGVNEVTGDDNKFYIKLLFKVNNLEGRMAYTVFHGITCMNEHIYRMVRKRTQKVAVIQDVTTADNWKLRMTTLAIMNRKSDTMLQKKMRKFVEKTMNETAAKTDIDDFVTGIISGVTQHKLRKAASKVYPLRFAEISKVRVLSAPSSMA